MIIDTMRELGIPITRDNWKRWNWMFDQVPDDSDIDPDIEASLPEEVRNFPKDDSE